MRAVVHGAAAGQILARGLDVGDAQQQPVG
jgi:hypothetical protein